MSENKVSLKSAEQLMQVAATKANKGENILLETLIGLCIAWQLERIANALEKIKIPDPHE